MVVPLMEGQGFEAMPVVPDVTGAENVVDAVVRDEVGDWVVVGLLVLCWLRVSLNIKGEREEMRCFADLVVSDCVILSLPPLFLAAIVPPTPPPTAPPITIAESITTNTQKTTGFRPQIVLFCPCP